VYLPAGWGQVVDDEGTPAAGAGGVYSFAKETPEPGGWQLNFRTQALDGGADGIGPGDARQMARVYAESAQGALSGETPAKRARVTGRRYIAATNTIWFNVALESPHGPMRDAVGCRLAGRYAVICSMLSPADAGEAHDALFRHMVKAVEIGPALQGGGPPLSPEARRERGDRQERFYTWIASGVIATIIVIYWLVRRLTRRSRRYTPAEASALARAATRGRSSLGRRNASADGGAAEAPEHAGKGKAEADAGGRKSPLPPEPPPPDDRL
jgi:hypothetical protein